VLVWHDCGYVATFTIWFIKEWHISEDGSLRPAAGILDTAMKMNMKIRFIIKKLSNPHVRRRLKIGLSVYAGLIILGVMFKVVYDIGYFNAQSLKNDKNAELPTTYPVLTLESAQRIVVGALKEDPTNPKTTVVQIIDNNHKLSTIIIENNKIKKIAWIIDLHLFFTGDLFNDQGYNLTEGVEHQYNINPDDR
jgi:hypothetical protein